MGDQYTELIIRAFQESDLNEAKKLFSHLKKEDISNLFETSLREKCFPQIYNLLSELFPIPEKYLKVYHDYKKRRSICLELIETAGKFNAEFLVLKGVAFEHFIPFSYQREFGDVDILVPSIEELWAIAPSYLDQGYDFLRTMLLYQHFKKDRILGRCKLEKEDEVAIEGDLLGIEICVGGFILSYRTAVLYEDIAYDFEWASNSGIKYRVPGAESSFLLYLCEQIQRERIRIRELFDLYYVLEKAQSFNVNRVAEKMEELGLVYEFQRLLSAYDQYPLIKVPSTLVQLADRLLIKKLETEGQLPQNIWKGHILPFIKHQIKNPLSYQYVTRFIERLNEKINDGKWTLFVKWLGDFVGTKTCFENNIPVHFIYLHSDSSKMGRIEWFKLRKFDVVKTPVGTFLTSSHALITDQELNWVLEESQNTKVFRTRATSK